MYRSTKAGLRILTVAGSLSLAGSAVAGDLGPGVERIPEPRVIEATRVAPVYPIAAEMEGMTGTVMLKALVLPDGKVARVRVAECDAPNYGFETASMDALRQWEFRPAIEDGQAVEAVQYVRFHFRIEEQYPSDNYQAESYGGNPWRLTGNSSVTPTGYRTGPRRGGDSRIQTVNLPAARLYDRSKLIPPGTGPSRRGAGTARK